MLRFRKPNDEVQVQETKTALGVTPAKFVRRQRPGKTPKLHFAPEPAHVFLQPENGEKVSISLQELVQSRCQSLYSKFRPAPWLFKLGSNFLVVYFAQTRNSAHLQTLYSVLGDFSKTDQVQYQR
jgi:hypothetical protein